jgi:hypothetical protein
MSWHISLFELSFLASLSLFSLLSVHHSVCIWASLFAFVLLSISSAAERGCLCSRLRRSWSGARTSLVLASSRQNFVVTIRAPLIGGSGANSRLAASYPRLDFGRRISNRELIVGPSFNLMQPMEIYVDDEAKLTLHGLVQVCCKQSCFRILGFADTKLVVPACLHMLLLMKAVCSYIANFKPQLPPHML